jgi:hypothetical protein
MELNYKKFEAITQYYVKRCYALETIHTYAGRNYDGAKWIAQGFGGDGALLSLEIICIKTITYSVTEEK